MGSFKMFYKLGVLLEYVSHIIVVTDIIRTKRKKKKGMENLKKLLYRIHLVESQPLISFFVKKEGFDTYGSQIWCTEISGGRIKDKRVFITNSGTITEVYTSFLTFGTSYV